MSHRRITPSTPAPILRPPIRGMADWTLCECVSIAMSDAGILDIERGFRFDGASIPRFFWRLIGHPFEGSFIVPALCHDCLYASEWLDRGHADEIFLRLLKQYGVGMFKRNSMYMAVALCGGTVWADHTQDSVKKARQLSRIR